MAWIGSPDCHTAGARRIGATLAPPLRRQFPAPARLPCRRHELRNPARIRSGRAEESTTVVTADIDLDAARASYGADGHWTSPVLFTPAEITSFLDATESVVAGRHHTGRAPALCLPFEPG